MDATEQWIYDRCNSNIQHIKGPIRGVVVCFPALGTGYSRNLSSSDLLWAEKNILFVVPFYGPWSWMNRLARQFVDELLEKIYAYYQIPDTAPVIANGGSMGGLSALLYCRYGKRRPAGCAVLYPVCDAVYHFRERPDVTPTMCCAFYGYPEDFDHILREQSALHQVEQMPRIPYLFFHGDADQAVSKSHSDRMTAALRESGNEVEYHEVPGMGHAANVPEWVRPRIEQFVIDLVDQVEKQQ